MLGVPIFAPPNPKESTMVLTTRRRSVLAAAILATIAATAACIPPPSGPPPTTTPPTTTPPPADPIVAVSPGAGDLDPVTVAPGQTVTINGSGFTETGNLGVRPPFFNTPAGVYVVFGRFADPWRVSEGAPSSARQIIEQVWALPTPSFNQLGGLAGTVEMGPGGTFSITVTAVEAAGSNPDYGIAILPGSGAINPSEEIFIPITLSVE